MIPLATGLAILAALQSGKPQEKSDLPPFTLVVTAKTGKLVPGDLAPLIQAIRGMKGFAEQKSRERSRIEGEWLEDWTFEIPGDKKFDPTPFWHAFTRYNARRYYLTMTGTLSQEAQTKKLFLNSFAGKSKVKLMNRPKDVFDKEGKAEDLVAKMAKELEEGRPHFTVSGEIFSHGGTLAILLDSYEEADPPPKPKEEKK
ncbi:MAG TPA: hypothetical protein VJU16_00975 [Planctomycetota bacterium]|nr:hypothetical protein [Planctomycetota bacterium]